MGIGMQGPVGRGGLLGSEVCQGSQEKVGQCIRPADENMSSQLRGKMGAEPKSPVFED